MLTPSSFRTGFFFVLIYGLCLFKPFCNDDLILGYVHVFNFCSFGTFGTSLIVCPVWILLFVDKKGNTSPHIPLQYLVYLYENRHFNAWFEF